MTDNQPQQNFWKKCNVCKKEIPFETAYQVCDVSTCQNKRTGLTFCTVECWDSHLGFANHRKALAEERRSPSREVFLRGPSGVAPPRRYVATAPPQAAPSLAQIQTDTLVVVSKVKKLINDQSGFNTSQCAIDALTKKVVRECLKAIAQARQKERKTVMGRDFES